MTEVCINDLKLPDLLVAMVEKERWQAPDDLSELGNLIGENRPLDYTFLSFDGMKSETDGSKELAANADTAAIYGLYATDEDDAQGNESKLNIEKAVLIAVNWDEEAIFLDYRQDEAAPSVVLGYWARNGDTIQYRQLTKDFATFAAKIGL